MLFHYFQSTTLKMHQIVNFVLIIQQIAHKVKIFVHLVNVKKFAYSQYYILECERHTFVIFDYHYAYTVASDFLKSYESLKSKKHGSPSYPRHDDNDANGHWYASYASHYILQSLWTQRPSSYCWPSGIINYMIVIIFKYVILYHRIKL